MNLDLFYNGSFQQNIKKLKEDLKKYAQENSLLLPDPFNIVKLRPSCVGSCVLFICPPAISSSLFTTAEDKLLDSLCKEYEIENKAITYCYIFQSLHKNKNVIKEFSPWIKKLTDLIQPKLIITLGEDAQCSFFRNKFLMRDCSSTIIGNYSDIPIGAIYPMDYFISKTGFEDLSFKQYLKKSNWDFVKAQYDKLIGDKT